MNKKAFSLVELMVAVAIIALLAAISIPNYFKYIAKAKQTEVMTNLVALHTAQLLHFAESGKYSSKLSGEESIDWQPGGYKKDGENNFYYTYGFNVPGSQEGVSYFIGKQKTPKDKLGSTLANETSFIASAACDLRGKGKIDVWTIDENRNIKHVQDGLK
jgi:prepilin-type N-terminal cleavage/methylation domain-containing protein